MRYVLPAGRISRMSVQGPDLSTSHTAAFQAPAWICSCTQESRRYPAQLFKARFDRHLAVRTASPPHPVRDLLPVQHQARTLLIHGAISAGACRASRSAEVKCGAENFLLVATQGETLSTISGTSTKKNAAPLVMASGSHRACEARCPARSLECVVESGLRGTASLLGPYVEVPDETQRQLNAVPLRASSERCFWPWADESFMEPGLPSSSTHRASANTALAGAGWRCESSEIW